MSFTSTVKTELASRISNAKHCRVAEIAALISMCGNVIIDENDKYKVLLKTDTEVTANKFKELIWKAFHIDTTLTTKNNPLSHSKNTYIVIMENSDDVISVLKETGIMNENGEIEETLNINKNRVIKKDCCKRAYIRGAFLAAGSVNNPEKSYHFEIKCSNEAKANQLVELLEVFDIESRIIKRKDKNVVYLKESEKVVDVLNVMEAPIALMEVENVRILKDMSNQINRQNNCDTANIKKTVESSQKKIEDIKYIEDTIGINNLPEKLQDIARIRLENPEDSLQELGNMMNPPLGKSGVNHRLRKISEIANDLRKESGE